MRWRAGVRGRSASARLALVLAAAGTAVGLLGIGAAPASAFQLGLTDPAYSGGNATIFDRTVNARAGLVLLGAPWASIAPTDPPAGFDGSNPNSPGYSWSSLDASVAAAQSRGLRVALLVTQAPAWAEGPNRPAGVTAGSWKPDPSALGKFGQAIAKRYPSVRYFQLWAEPNLSLYLTPQWKHRRPVSPVLYRKMLNAFYAGIKSVSGADKVLTGGTGPYGDRPGGLRVPPATFWQTLLCFNGAALHPVHCSDPAHFDIAAHNPIDIGPPTQHAASAKDISTPDLGRLTRILRKAQRTGRSKPHGRKPLWATEFWWDSNPPDPAGIPELRQARWLEQAIYLFWKQGAAEATWFQVDDPAPVPSYAATTQSGLFFQDGSPKLAYSAYRFPFVADRLGGRTVRVWGMAPSSGGVSVQRKSGGGWRTLKRLHAGGDRVFVGKISLRGGATLRASAGGETSLSWQLR
jgi:hypothetical protein